MYTRPIFISVQPTSTPVNDTSERIYILLSREAHTSRTIACAHATHVHAFSARPQSRIRFIVAFSCYCESVNHYKDKKWRRNYNRKCRDWVGIIG